MNRSRSNHSAASSRSMWCCSPHPQQVQETLFAGRANKTSAPDSKTSSQVIISLITEISISQTTKKSTVKTKKNEKKLFYFMLTLGTILSHRTACWKRKLLIVNDLSHAQARRRKSLIVNDLRTGRVSRCRAKKDAPPRNDNSTGLLWDWGLFVTRQLSPLPFSEGECKTPHAFKVIRLVLFLITY